MAEETHPAVEQSIAELFIQAELLSPQLPTNVAGLLEQGTTSPFPAPADLERTLPGDVSLLKKPSVAAADTDNNNCAPSTSSSKPELPQPNLDEAKDAQKVEAPVKRQKRSRHKRSRPRCEQYVIKFKGNDSKVWDGKPIAVDADWIEEKYSKSELFPGRVIDLDWPDPKSKTNVSWRCVVDSLPEGETLSDEVEESSVSVHQQNRHQPTIATTAISDLAEEEVQERADQLYKLEKPRGRKSQSESKKQKSQTKTKKIQKKPKSPQKKKKKSEGKIVCVGKDESDCSNEGEHVSGGGQVSGGGDGQVSGGGEVSRGGHVSEVGLDHGQQGRNSGQPDKMDQVLSQLVQQQERMMDILSLFATRLPPPGLQQPSAPLSLPLDPPPSANSPSANSYSYTQLSPQTTLTPAELPPQAPPTQLPPPETGLTPATQLPPQVPYPATQFPPQTTLTPAAQLPPQVPYPATQFPPQTTMTPAAQQAQSTLYSTGSVQHVQSTPTSQSASTTLPSYSSLHSTPRSTPRSSAPLSRSQELTPRSSFSVSSLPVPFQNSASPPDTNQTSVLESYSDDFCWSDEDSDYHTSRSLCDADHRSQWYVPVSDTYHSSRDASCSGNDESVFELRKKNFYAGSRSDDSRRKKFQGSSGTSGSERDAFIDLQGSSGISGRERDAFIDLSHDLFPDRSNRDAPLRNALPNPSRRETPRRDVIPPLPFSTPPKLKPVDDVMMRIRGTDVNTLRKLTSALARESIFGRKELAKLSLSGRNNTVTLDQEKLNYIKTVVRGRVPDMSDIEFESVWKFCKGTLSKSCQTIRASERKRLLD